MTAVLAQVHQMGLPSRRRAARPESERWGLALGVGSAALWGASFVVGFEPTLAALMALALLAAVFGIFRPVLGLLGIGMLCTLDAPARVFLLTGGLWRWNTINYWLLLVIVLFLPLILSCRDVHTRLLQLLLGLLVAGLVISSNLVFGAQHVIGLVAALGILVYLRRAQGHRAALYWLGFVCGLLSAVGSAVYMVHRVSLPYINPNVFAAFPLAGTFAICLALRDATAMGRGHVLLSALAAANLASVFLTGSRGAMLIGTCCALFIVLTLPRLQIKTVSLAVAGLVTLGLLTQFTELQTVATHRVGNLIDAGRSMSDRTSGRYDLVLGAVHLFENQPLGVGTGGFADAWQDLTLRSDFTDFRQGRPEQAHSAWTKTLAENGLPGVALLAAYVFSFALVGLRSRRREARALGLLTTAALSVAFVSTEFQSKGIWMLAAGATIVLQYPHPRSPSRHSPEGG